MGSSLKKDPMSTLLTDFNACGVPETSKSDTLGNKRPGGHKIRVEVDGHPKGKGDGEEEVVRGMPSEG